MYPMSLLVWVMGWPSVASCHAFSLSFLFLARLFKVLCVFFLFRLLCDSRDLHYLELLRSNL